MSIQEIQKTLDIFKPGKLVEIRSFGSRTTSGYFKDFDNLAKCLQQFQNETYYFVLNSINDACYSREQSEKITIKPKATTSDNDISRRDWILIDADPTRATGVSATDEEKEKAKDIIGKVYRYLRNIGFNTPVSADSGNGYHLLYNICLNNTPDNTELIKTFLQVIDMLFSDEYVKIDTAVFNASRITKLYGTIARKGSNTAERPHRPSQILKIPDEIKPTSKALIQNVAALLPKPEKTSHKNYGASQFDIDDFMSKHGIRISKIAKWTGGTKYILDECLFDRSHKAPDAAICVLDNGALSYHCFHNSCQGRTWQDVRLLFEPGAYDVREQPRTTKPFTPSMTRQEIQQAPPAGVKTEHFLRLQDIKRLDRSKIVSVKSGISALDKKMIGFNKGEFSVWSGGNGSGKSTILSQMAIEAINSGFNVAMFSGELTSERVKNWLHLQAAGRQHTKQSQYANVYYTPKDISDKIDAWTGDRLWVYNNDYGMNVDSVIADLRVHIEKYKTDVVIIDNLMSLDLTKLQGDKYDRQSILVLTLSDMAKRHNIHIHFVCHPRKPNGFLRKADISGTADLTNAADNVIMVHRVNNDFRKYAKDFFEKGKAEYFFDYSNVIEVMKNRDLGVEDELIGLYFEEQSKRMLNEPHENKNYNWNDDFLGEEINLPDNENPFL